MLYSESVALIAVAERLEAAAGGSSDPHTKLLRDEAWALRKLAAPYEDMPSDRRLQKADPARLSGPLWLG